ncbi:two-component system OmpR family response regulator [Erwinia persicina]|jgi:two-component system OmpR family response regulator|uniref:Response regulator transcription factor HprR n=1 Tax=Erwinia plantamica TaxID=3237104 RepID=A0ABW7CNH1_9GAMM|nr:MULTISPECIES: response regulator transcription factor HprR [Erwinia]MCP1440140.1 two-component system OmpR family response regulator [Erwinia persicina]MDN4627566.1 response regulator transcription factor HprR [Erwinia sp. PsM31]MDN8543277.1 response regulator transcription factor HprR [Erwinia sp. BC051422]
MKLLLIEDNQKASDWLCQGLREAGFVVDSVTDGRDGLHLALSQNYALIVLDIMLPGMDGWQVLRSLRTARATPVICLTARDSVNDRVKGLELGANDYLVKPFSFAELLARIRAQLRQNHPTQAVLTVGDLVMDSVRQTASRQGESVALTRREFALLWLLASRRGEIVPRTLIASEVWGINFDSETNTVDVAIRRLRRKIDDPYEPKLIDTVRGMGYRLAEPGEPHA